jgi:nucleoside-diphosphate-sugar epimerase
MNLLVFGSTGLVGSGILREALLDPAFHSVTAVLRTGKSLAPDITAQSSSKLIKLHHDNFLDYTSEEILNSFKQRDLVCIWALGISLTKGTTDEEFTTVTHDYVMAAAEKMIEVNRGGVKLLHVSGEGK